MRPGQTATRGDAARAETCGGFWFASTCHRDLPHRERRRRGGRDRRSRSPRTCRSRTRHRLGSPAFHRVRLRNGRLPVELHRRSAVPQANAMDGRRTALSQARAAPAGQPADAKAGRARPNQDSPRIRPGKTATRGDAAGAGNVRGILVREHVQVDPGSNEWPRTSPSSISPSPATNSRASSGWIPDGPCSAGGEHPGDPAGVGRRQVRTTPLPPTVPASMSWWARTMSSSR